MDMDDMVTICNTAVTYTDSENLENKEAEKSPRSQDMFLTFMTSGGI